MGIISDMTLPQLQLCLIWTIMKLQTEQLKMLKNILAACPLRIERTKSCCFCIVGVLQLFSQLHAITYGLESHSTSTLNFLFHIEDSTSTRIVLLSSQNNAAILVAFFTMVIIAVHRRWEISLPCSLESCHWITAFFQVHFITTPATSQSHGLEVFYTAVMLWFF